MYRALASPARKQDITRTGNIYTLTFEKFLIFRNGIKSCVSILCLVGYAESFNCKGSIISAVIEVCTANIREIFHIPLYGVTKNAGIMIFLLKI